MTTAHMGKLGELKKTLMGSKYVVVSLRIKQSLFSDINTGK
jgi:hypothetical protein